MSSRYLMMVCLLVDVYEKSLLEGSDSKLSSSVSGDSSSSLYSWLSSFLYGLFQSWQKIILANFIKLLFWCCDCYFWNSSFDLSSDYLQCSNSCFLHLISFCSYQLKKHSHNIFQRLFFIWSSCIQRKASKFFIWHQMSG